MAEPMDDPGYTKARDVSGFQEKEPLFPAALPDDDDDIARRIVYRTQFPGVMLAAGVLWILAGAVYVSLFALFRFMGLPFQWSNLWLLLMAALFVKDGVQLLRGKFRDPFMDGIITVGLGIFFIGSGVLGYDQPGGIVAFVVNSIFGVIFLVPGILVLVGRKQYLAWKTEQQAEELRSAAPPLAE